MQTSPDFSVQFSIVQLPSCAMENQTEKSHKCYTIQRLIAKNVYLYHGILLVQCHIVAMTIQMFLNDYTNLKSNHTNVVQCLCQLLHSYTFMNTILCACRFHRKCVFSRKTQCSRKQVKLNTQTMQTCSCTLLQHTIPVLQSIPALSGPCLNHLMAASYINIVFPLPD